MKTLHVKVRVWAEGGGNAEMDGTAYASNTDAATLREVVEEVIPPEFATKYSWEAFFYDAGSKGVLRAYLSDSNEHEVLCPF